MGYKIIMTDFLGEKHFFSSTKYKSKYSAQRVIEKEKARNKYLGSKGNSRYSLRKVR